MTLEQKRDSLHPPTGEETAHKHKQEDVPQSNQSAALECSRVTTVKLKSKRAGDVVPEQSPEQSPGPTSPGFHSWPHGAECEEVFQMKRAATTRGKVAKSLRIANQNTQ